MERWLAVPGYKGLYEVSNLGRVRSWHSKGPKPRYLKPSSIRGYLRFHLSKSGMLTSHLAHRLVLAAFVGASDLPANHLNGNRADNRLCNLEYVTASENMIHAFTALGRKAKRLHGEKNPASKLTSADVVEIRRMLREGLRQKDIANHFGISESQLSAIKHGKSRKIA